ncbi:hypothetical protein D9M71_753420 [compost metagenome]
MAIHEAHLPLQHVLLHDVVVMGDDHPSPQGEVISRTAVELHGGNIARVPDVTNSRVLQAQNELRRPVTAAIVENQQLEILEALAEHGSEGLLEVVQSVVSQQSNGQRRNGWVHGMDRSRSAI